MVIAIIDCSPWETTTARKYSTQARQGICHYEYYTSLPVLWQYYFLGLGLPLNDYFVIIERYPHRGDLTSRSII